MAAEILVAEVDRILPRLRGRDAHAADNLQRSAESVLFNTGEGVAAFKPKVKVAAYEVALRELNEVRLILRLLVRRRRLEPDQTRRAYNLADSIASMLVSAIRKIR